MKITQVNKLATAIEDNLAALIEAARHLDAPERYGVSRFWLWLAARRMARARRIFVKTHDMMYKRGKKSTNKDVTDFVFGPGDKDQKVKKVSKRKTPK